MIKIIYHTKDGAHEEPLINEWHSLRFANGVPADSEHLKFYAQHCDAHVEVSRDDLAKAFVPRVIPVKEGQ